MERSESPQEPRRGLSRWEEVIYPPYTIQKETPPRKLPRWLERQQAKDLTGQVRDGS